MLYTPDCSKILLYYKHTNNKFVYVYLNAADGAILHSFGKNNCCAKIHHKDGIVLSQTGERIYSIYNRPAKREAVLNRVEYYNGSSAFTGSAAR